MPQYPSPRLGANFETLTSSGGALRTLAISAPTVLTNPNGRTGCLCRVSVLTAGTTPGAAYDAATLGAAAPANQIMVIPNTIGTIEVDWPCLAGIVITPGTGQVISASFL